MYSFQVRVDSLHFLHFLFKILFPESFDLKIQIFRSIDCDPTDVLNTTGVTTHKISSHALEKYVVR